jgi:hypothetical protein
MGRQRRCSSSTRFSHAATVHKRREDSFGSLLASVTVATKARSDSLCAAVASRGASQVISGNARCSPATAGYLIERNQARTDFGSIRTSWPAAQSQIVDADHGKAHTRWRPKCHQGGGDVVDAFRHEYTTDLPTGRYPSFGRIWAMEHSSGL